MNNLIWSFLFLSVVISDLSAQKTVENYVYFNINRHRIQENSFLDSDIFSGAQLKYTWPELEPEKGVYNFELIRKDLAFLKANGKKLFIQIQDVSFDSAIVNVPKYMIEDPIYHGGVEFQVDLNDDGTEYIFAGLVARRWDKEVAKRFHKLLEALGEKFDGEITGINLPETIIGFGTTEMHPSGYSYDSYRDAIKENMRVMKDAFPNSTIIIYANFMPGDNFPLGENSYLESIYRYARELNVGMGGPDIKVYKWWQMQHSYKFIKESRGKIPLGIAVQWGNYELVNPKTGNQVTIEEIYNFGSNELALDYIFWSTQEPFYSNHLIPFLGTK